MSFNDNMKDSALCA